MNKGTKTGYVGFGSKQADLVVYLPNRPQIDEFINLDSFRALRSGEVQEIISQCGNHWRKIFSIYAKIAFAIDPKDYSTWQQYRDTVLLTDHGAEAVIFGCEIVPFSEKTFHFIAGRAHFDAFSLKREEFKEIGNDGKIFVKNRIFQIPYFDYRQFPNKLVEKIVIFCK